MEEGGGEGKLQVWSASFTSHTPQSVCPMALLTQLFG